MITWPDLWFGPINLWNCWRYNMSGGIENWKEEQREKDKNTFEVREEFITTNSGGNSDGGGWKTSVRKDYLEETVFKSSLNKLSNCKNHYQGRYKKVLCVCSAGLLRSPTIALTLSGEPFNYNTRCVGINEEYALIDISEVLLEWADEFVVAESWMGQEVEKMLDNVGLSHKDIISLDIPDIYPYRDPRLIKLIKDNYLEKIDNGV